jgi:NAD(P)-dependent dehydrogenase (short-subunit alcohol dehydrogenase family)
MRSVVVTGASTGIGWGCVKVMTGKGFHIFGSVRKQADADRLKAEFDEAFTPLLFDVTDAPAVNRAAEEAARALGNSTLAGLVNNAGIAVAGPMLYLDIDELRRQLEVNVVGQAIVTQAFAPLLGADRSRQGDPGRIVMISSVGGRSSNPFTGPYNASKFALEGMSETLRRELMIFGIDVIVIAPGAVATPIWDKAEEIDVSRYANTPYAASLAKVKDYMLTLGRKGFPPEKIGEAVYTALTAKKPKVRYTVTPDRMQNFMVTTLPKRMVDNFIAKQLGLKKPGA